LCRLWTHLAVGALGRARRVEQVARRLGDVGRHVGLARLAVGRREASVLVVGALDGDVAHRKEGLGAEDVRPRVEVVQPVTPEGGDLGVRDEDTRERGKDTEEDCRMTKSRRVSGRTPVVRQQGKTYSG
jgi:hypothetical protein